MAEAIAGNIKPVLSILIGHANDTMTVAQARYAVLAYAAATAVGASMFTRERAIAGKAPILNVLF